MKRIAAIAVCIAISFSLCSCKREEQKASDTLFAMDTYMTFTVYGDRGGEIIEQCKDEIKRLDRLLSSENEDSEIFMLNKSEEFELSNEVAGIIKKCLEISKATDGSFDITVGALTKLWGFSGGNYRLPSEDEIALALDSVGYEKISLEGNVLKKPAQTKLDLGGIAKGYATDRLFEILEENDVKGAVFSLGGNVLTFGQNTKGEKWSVAVTDPKDKNRFVKTVEREGNLAFVTSGDYQRYFEQNGKKYHHILDPKTGYPSKGELSSVTVISKSGFYADGLSTALFVAGEQKASEFAKNTDAFEAIYITSDGEVSEQRYLK